MYVNNDILDLIQDSEVDHILPQDGGLHVISKNRSGNLSFISFIVDATLKVLHST